MINKEIHTTALGVHQGNLVERIMHYNLHGGVDNGISGIIIPCQPPRGDFNALSFLLNFPDAHARGCPVLTGLQVLSGVKAEIVSNVLPKELSVVINDLLANMHTCMLAVYSHQVPVAIKCWVTLFPMHNIILVSHCAIFSANLPILQSSAPATPKSAGESISIPVVPLCNPAPEVFPQLSTFLYTKCIDHLLATLLPQPAPASLYTEDPTSKSMHTQLQQLMTKLSVLTPAHVLLACTTAVNGP